MMDEAKQIDYSCDFLKEALFQFEVGLGRLFGFHENISQCTFIYAFNIDFKTRRCEY